MADTKTPAERSENMSRIRSTNTKPEEIVRKYLFSHGFRYRKNDKRYPGKPDIVLPKYHTIIFVNGCFWHMHGCSRSRLPRSNQEYWKPKIERNIQRDAENQQKLEADGWKVIVVSKGTGKNSKYFIEIIRKYRRSNECKGKILKHIEVVFII